MIRDHSVAVSLPGGTEAPLPTLQTRMSSRPHCFSTLSTSSFAAAGAVIANALSDALGSEAKTLPLTPERVRNLIKQGQGV